MSVTAAVQNLAWLAVRQVNDPEAPAPPADAVQPAPVECSTSNDYDGRMGLRISAIFVILVGSFLGACFPVFASRRRGLGVPEVAFFFFKYFGSGVIIATAFIHLLAPAVDNLTNECLTGPITDYDWAEGIALMTIFVLFFIELMVMRFAKFGGGHDHEKDNELGEYSDDERKGAQGTATTPNPHMPGEDHLGHARDHVDNDEVAAGAKTPAVKTGWINPESYSAQLTGIFVLEFGVIFHSIFIGLTLAVAGSEFTTLYIVLVFHQTFEGLGLGSRLASVPWPKSKRWTPYILGTGYALSTPIAIAIGLGVRETYLPNSQTTLIVNGVFDSISAGILLYTGLVELMAHEFMFSPYMQKAPLKNLLMAFFFMVLGAGLMAVLGRWA